jgi:hypothetical protein
VWAYSNGTQWSKDHKPNWDLRPTWEYGDGGLAGVIQWATELGPEVGLSQFPVSQPLVPDRALVEQLVQRRLEREEEVEAYVNEGMVHGFDLASPEHNRVFEKRFNVCRPSFGSGCAYLHACHNANVGADPLGSGLYKVRVPHHDVAGDEQ